MERRARLYRARPRLSRQYFLIRAATAVRFAADHPGARVAVREAGSGVRLTATGGTGFGPLAADPAARSRDDGGAESRTTRFWRVAGTDAGSD